MIRRPRLPRLRALAGRLRADRSGLALLEFALALPLFISAGCWCTELSFLALTNLRISQYALNLADTASRVGIDAGAGVTDLREADVNDVLAGVKLQGAGIKLTTYGRVTISSLEKVKQTYDSSYVQRIHWQRCIGLKSGTDYESHYGTTSVTAGSTNTSANAGTQSNGMGEPTAMVTAPKDGGVMFVEVNYNYQPLFGNLFVGQRVIRYVASFIVRDNRNFQQITNPTPTATRSTCDLHTA